LAAPLKRHAEGSSASTDLTGQPLFSQSGNVGSRQDSLRPRPAEFSAGRSSAVKVSRHQQIRRRISLRSTARLAFATPDGYAFYQFAVSAINSTSSE